MYVCVCVCVVVLNSSVLNKLREIKWALLSSVHLRLHNHFTNMTPNEPYWIIVSALWGSVVCVCVCVCVCLYQGQCQRSCRGAGACVQTFSGVPPPSGCIRETSRWRSRALGISCLQRCYSQHSHSSHSAHSDPICCLHPAALLSSHHVATAVKKRARARTRAGKGVCVCVRVLYKGYKGAKK